MRNIFKFSVVFFLLLSSFSFFAQVPDVLSRAYKASLEASSLSSTIDDKIWAGFRFKEYPIIIFESRERNAIAINFNPPPSNFKQVENSAISYGKIPTSEPLASGLRAFSNRLVAFIDEKNLNSYPSARIIEEAFKLFEAYRGFNDQGSFLPGAYPFLNAENNALARCENLCLLKAISSEPQDVKPLLSSFYSFRTKRESLIPKEIAEVENSRELVDGLASYAAFSSLPDESKKTYLNELMNKLSEYNKGGNNADKRFKDTGFAIIYLFNKLKFDYKGAIEKSPKNSLMAVLKPYIEGVAPKDTSSFINLEEIKSAEAQSANQKAAQIAQTLSAIQKAEGLVLVIKIDDVLKSTEGKLNWSNWFEPEGLTYIEQDKIIFTRYFKLSANTFFSFASSRAVYVEVRKAITAGFAKDEIPFITIDGKGAEFAKDSPPATGPIEIKGAHFEFKAAKAKATWDYTTRTLTVEPIYETGS